MRLRGGSALRRTSDLAAEREQADADDQGTDRNGQAAGAGAGQEALLQGHGQPWAVVGEGVRRSRGSIRTRPCRATEVERRDQPIACIGSAASLP